MNYKSFGLAASLVLAVDAFMIPSTMSMPGAKGQGLEALKAFDPSRMANDDTVKDGGQIVKLDCPGCKIEGVDDLQMALILNWTITNHGKDLNLNDRTFIGEGFADFSQPYEAPQIPRSLPDNMVPIFTAGDSVTYFSDGASKPIEIKRQELGFSGTKRSVTATDDTNDQLLDIDFKILQVNSHSPTGVDALTLRLIQKDDGVLNLLEIIRVPADGSASYVESDEESKPTHAEDEEQTFEILPVSPLVGEHHGSVPPAIKHHSRPVVDCHGMPLSLCKMKYTIGKKIQAMHHAIATAVSGDRSRPHHRPCGGMRHGPPGLNIKGGVAKYTAPDGTPILHVPYHRHGPHQMVHKACRVMRRFFFGFVVPVMIGVAAGMTASLAGMVVGTALAMLWFRYRRGGKRGSENAAAAEEGEIFEREELISKEGEAFAEPRYSEDTLPAYEEKPNQTE